jgi:hypothetical protein
MTRDCAQTDKGLVDGPDVALAEEGFEVAFAFFGDGLFDLLLEQDFVGGALDGAEDADGHGVVGVVQAREQEGEGGVLQGFVWGTLGEVPAPTPRPGRSRLRPYNGGR